MLRRIMGIRVDRNSYQNVVPAFVVWLDKSFPHLQGILSIEVDQKGAASFCYEPRDGIRLSDMDKVLIRRKWESSRQETVAPTEKRDDNDNIIRLINEGQYGTVISILACRMDKQIRKAMSRPERF